MTDDGSPQMKRWFEILRLLQSEVPVSRESLAREVELSVRQVERILRQLSQLGFPIENIWGKGYRISTPVPRLPLQLSPDEVWALLLLQHCAPKALGSAANGSLFRLIDRLRTQVGENVQQRMTQLRTQLASDPAVEEVSTEVWSTLTEAISKELQVRIYYQKIADPEPVERRLDPWSLLTIRSHWYVHGLDHLSGLPKNFRLSRIHRIHLLSLKAEPRPSGYQASQSLFHRLEIGEGEPLEVELVGDEFFLSWYRENPLHPEQRIEGQSLFLRVRNQELLLQMMAGMKGLLRVEPPGLRQKLMEFLEAQRARLSLASESTESARNWADQGG